MPSLRNRVTATALTLVLAGGAAACGGDDGAEVREIDGTGDESGTGGSGSGTDGSATGGSGSASGSGSGTSGG